MNAEQVVFINKDFVVSCCWFLRLKTIQNFFYCIPVYVLYANVNLWEWHAIMKIPTCTRFSSKCSWWVFMLTSYSPNVPCMLSKHVHVRDSPIAQDVNKKNISDSSTCTRENVIVYKSLYLIVFCWLVLDSIFCWLLLNNK